LGTAFLVAPDLVLTNHHVALDPRLGDFRPRPETVRFRFGFRESATVGPAAGTAYGLAAAWEVHRSHSDKPGHRLGRLSRRRGEGPVGDFKDAPRRGWLKLKKADVGASQGLFILQHPQGDTLKMANGGVKARSGAWVDYEVDTEPGSSGSPVFDNRWELVALHS